jgi:hypothetical protein
MPRHSFAIRNNVLLQIPPSMQAKQPRSRLIVCSTSPPSRTRTQRLLGTSPYQTAFSASMQMPSGAPSPRSAHTRCFDRVPSRSRRRRRGRASRHRSPASRRILCAREAPLALKQSADGHRAANRCRMEDQMRSGLRPRSCHRDRLQ